MDVNIPQAVIGGIAGFFLGLFFRWLYDRCILKYVFRKIVGTYSHGNVDINLTHVHDNTFHVEEIGGTTEAPIRWGGVVEKSGNFFKGYYDWNIGSGGNKPDFGEYFLRLLPDGRIVSFTNDLTGNSGAQKFIWNKK